MWLLLALLLAGAASYTQGSRYALLPSHGQVQAADEQISEELPSTAATAASPVDASASAWPTPVVVHAPGLINDPEESDKDCCERRHAPRSEPAPVRTGAVEPPSLTTPQADNSLLSSVAPPEPDLPVLSVVQLSISRT
ncbi:hypothetical protein FDW83_14845 [Pseudarthrobacter sp. NamE2]|uniref:hypothetical protein n=1 Tax=Pseudarthrobacter sp. NamE2 TaxID=2576838 RepID=UPI0010FE419B|nr:hypothetical protein [Pseudarthrobacter sp. NamE2]TLM81699.1 hypothetical protein FDW83_14845 [Pseudarthrobacter sp. NamE2]